MTNACAFGNLSNASGTLSVAVGQSAASGNYAVAIGAGADADNGGSWNSLSTAIGRASSAHPHGIALNAETTAENQFIAGGQYCTISDVYFGKGVSHATPPDVTIHGTGGSGTDVAGADLIIAAGR